VSLKIHTTLKSRTPTVLESVVHGVHNDDDDSTVNEASLTVEYGRTADTGRNCKNHFIQDSLFTSSDITRCLPNTLDTDTCSEHSMVPGH
jgi:hypothetical protein